MRFAAYARPSSGPSGHLLPLGEGDVSIPSPFGRGCREAAGEGRALATIVFVALFATGALAQEATTTTTTAPPPKPVESPLVKAAHAAKAKKLASTRKPITNADLKKAKSKLMTFEPIPVASTDTTASTSKAATDTKGPLEKEDERYRARKAAEERVNEAAAKVSDLEKEIDRVEQNYYNTNDPTERDTVIAKRFAQTRKQLEDARKELADARDALAALK
jgi:hypothetical protein